MKVQCSCADHRVDQERGILKLKPNSPNVKLMVSENGKEFFEKDFKVILVPKPKLDVVGKCGGSIISWQGDSLAIDDLVSSKLEQKADPLFRMLLSDESNYKTQKAEINWYDDKGNTCFRSEVLDNTISPKLSTEGLSRAKYIISKIEGTRLSNGKEEFAFFPKYIRQVKCLNIPPEKIDSIRCPVNFSCGLYNEK